MPKVGTAKTVPAVLLDPALDGEYSRQRTIMDTSLSAHVTVRPSVLVTVKLTVNE